MKPKPETRKVKTPATTQPTGETNRAPSSRRAMAATLSRPVRQATACTASARPGFEGSTAGVTIARARGSTFLAGAPVVRAACSFAAVVGTLRVRAICLRTLARARRRDDLLTFRRPLPGLGLRPHLFHLWSG